MEEIQPPVVESTRRASKFIVWTFAIVGFLAAVVQIISFFDTGGSQLRVSVTPFESAIPQFVANAIDDSEENEGYVSRLVKDGKLYFCEQAKSGSEQRKADEIAERRCKQFDGTEAVFKILRKQDGTHKYLDYEVENVGKSTAAQVRLTASEVFAVDLRTSNDEWRSLEQSKDQDFYALPNLNPEEKIRFRVWSTDYMIQPDASWLSKDEIPTVTFSGGRASMNLHRTVPQFYYDLHDLVQTFSLPLSLLFALFGCAIIGIGLLVVIAASDALLKGKPVSAIFKQPEAAEVDPKSEQPS